MAPEFSRLDVCDVEDQGQNARMRHTQLLLIKQPKSKQ